MKEKGKITRHAISPDEPRQFILLGIASAEPDYRLSVMLNKQLGISLQHAKAVSAGTGDNVTEYSVFTTSPAIYSLISNKYHGRLLISKLKNIDFILVIHGEPDRKKAEDIASVIRKNAVITAVFVFNSAELKDKNISLLAQ